MLIAALLVTTRMLWELRCASSLGRGTTERSAHRGRLAPACLSRLRPDGPAAMILALALLTAALDGEPPLAVKDAAMCYAVAGGAVEAYAEAKRLTPADLAYQEPVRRLGEAAGAALESAVAQAGITASSYPELFRDAAAAVLRSGGSDKVARACWSACGIDVPASGLSKR